MSNESNNLEVDLLLNKITILFDTINSSIQDHERSLNEMMKEKGFKNKEFQNLLISEIHVIDCIGKNHLCNATFISKQMNMTKGAISKITGKLLDKGLIKVNRLENNKKERYYTLTASGKEIFCIHAKLHEIENKKLTDLISKYNKEELNTMNHFIDDLINSGL